MLRPSEWWGTRAPGPRTQGLRRLADAGCGPRGWSAPCRSSPRRPARSSLWCRTRRSAWGRTSARTSSCPRSHACSRLAQGSRESPRRVFKQNLQVPARREALALRVRAVLLPKVHVLENVIKKATMGCLAPCFSSKNSKFADQPDRVFFPARPGLPCRSKKSGVPQ